MRKLLGKFLCWLLGDNGEVNTSAYCKREWVKVRENWK